MQDSYRSQLKENIWLLVAGAITMDHHRDMFLALFRWRQEAQRRARAEAELRKYRLEKLMRDARAPPFPHGPYPSDPHAPRVPGLEGGDYDRVPGGLFVPHPHPLMEPRRANGEGGLLPEGAVPPGARSKRLPYPYPTPPSPPLPHSCPL